MRGTPLTVYGKKYKDVINSVLQGEEYKEIIDNALEKAHNVIGINKSKDGKIKSGFIEQVDDER